MSKYVFVMINSFSSITGLLFGICIIYLNYKIRLFNFLRTKNYLNQQTHKNTKHNKNKIN